VTALAVASFCRGTASGMVTPDELRSESPRLVAAAMIRLIATSDTVTASEATSIMMLPRPLEQTKEQPLERAILPA
jgi:hypothetical protein